MIVLYLSMVPDNPGQLLKLSGIRRYCATRGWDAEVITRQDYSTAALPQILRERRPVGCIVEGISNNDIPPPRLFGSIAVSYLECPPDITGNTPNILVDDDAIAREAVRELSAGRPTSFAVATALMPHWWSNRRKVAFCKAVVAEYGPQCPIYSSPLKGQHEIFEDYRKRLEEWVASLPKNCAVFAVSDIIASRFVEAAHATLRDIPKELTLLSVNNHPEICETASPTISSIQLDLERMGFRAARALGERVTGKAMAKEVSPLLAVRRKSTSGRGRHEKFIIDAVAMIRNEAREGLTASDLAARFPVSRRLFELRFREATGHSVLDEIMHVRLEAVQSMLVRQDIPIGAIADFCGFSGYLSMQSAFRKRTGMTLREWRRRH